MINDILINLNDKLSNIDKIILLQQKEISKSESSLSFLKKCLCKQNEALKKFINERDKLQEEGPNRLRLSNINDRNFNEIYESVMKMGAQANNRKRKINVDPFKFLRTEDGEFNKEGFKAEVIGNDCNDQVGQSNQPHTIKAPLLLNYKPEHDLPVHNNANTQIEKIHIQEIMNKTVLKIVVFGNDICIGGSKGMFLKYRFPKTQVIITDTEEDILQIEVLKSKSIICLAAFTNSKILIYDGMGNRRDIYLPGIGNAFNDINDAIYIPTKKGVIKKLVSNDLTVVDHVRHKCGEVRSFILGKGKNRCDFITAEDSSLYIVEKRDFSELRVVNEVRDVVRILRVKYNKVLCYSKDKIWFFNADFEIIETVEIKHGIKFVDVTFTCGAVLDRDNTVHVYTLLDNGCFGEKLFEKKIDGVLTAMSMVKKKVFLADTCDIIVIEIIM